MVVVVGTGKLPHKDQKVQNANVIPEKDSVPSYNNENPLGTISKEPN